MRIFYLLLAAIILNGCSKNEALSPSPIAPLYNIPQGNAAYDNEIVSIYKDYSTYILYKFSQVDYAYNYTDKLADSAFNANPAYIEPTLNFFKNEILKVYPDSLLKKTLPVRILLASYIGSGTTRSVTGFASSRSMLCIGWADSTLNLKTAAELRKIKGNLHRAYIDRACQALTLSVPSAFIALCPSTYNTVVANNQYSEGVIEPVGTKLTLMSDFLGYVEYISSHTKAEAQATILSTAVDKKGIIKKKYNTVLSYFNDLGLDLQAIGEKQ